MAISSAFDTTGTLLDKGSSTTYDHLNFGSVMVAFGCKPWLKGQGLPLIPIGVSQGAYATLAQDLTYAGGRELLSL